MSMSTKDEEELIIPITEWPPVTIARNTASWQTSSESNGISAADKNNELADVFKLNSKSQTKLRKHSKFQPYHKHDNEPSTNEQINSQIKVKGNFNVFKSQHVSNYIDNEGKSECLSGQAVNICSEDPQEQHSNIDVKIAKWWRRYNASKSSNRLLKFGNANTTLYHITRLPECKKFLLSVKEQLLTDARSKRQTAEMYANLAGIEDRLGNYVSGLEHIENALLIQPDTPEYIWLREKLRRQRRVEEEQEKAQLSLTAKERTLRPFKEIQRISGKDLSVTEFQDNFVKAGKPVILTDVVTHMTKLPFDFSLVKAKAGSKNVIVKKFIQNSVEWARLEDGSSKTVGQFIEEVQTCNTSDYLFDWSLPIHCPDLAQEISLPAYFKDNLLLATTPGSLYRDSWPSLFVAPQGAVSNLHIDAFASHFWMALFQGEKRWTFFDSNDTALLYPKYFHSMDPVFDIDMGNPDMDKYPFLALTQPQQCVLKSGELLFVPAGSPHYVENLTPSLAVSSNYVNTSNFEKVCQELAVNALLDPRAKDLLKQFQQPGFDSHSH